MNIKENSLLPMNSRSFLTIHTGNGKCLLKTAIATITMSTYQTTAHIPFYKAFCTPVTSRWNKVTTVQDKVFKSNFGAHSPSISTLNVAQIHLITATVEWLLLFILIAPMIATPIQSVVHYSTVISKRTSLAQSVTTEQHFQSISLLIGAGYYWSIIESHIIRGNEPTAVKPKIRYFFLSGPMSHCNTWNASSTSLQTKVLDTRLYNLKRFCPLTHRQCQINLTIPLSSSHTLTNTCHIYQMDPTLLCFHGNPATHHYLLTIPCVNKGHNHWLINYYNPL